MSAAVLHDPEGNNRQQMEKKKKRTKKKKKIGRLITTIMAKFSLTFPGEAAQSVTKKKKKLKKHKDNCNNDQFPLNENRTREEMKY